MDPKEEKGYYESKEQGRNELLGASLVLAMIVLALTAFWWLTKVGWHGLH